VDGILDLPEIGVAIPVADLFEATGLADATGTEEVGEEG
jgi:hypothetical protein